MAEASGERWIGAMTRRWFLPAAAFFSATAWLWPLAGLPFARSAPAAVLGGLATALLLFRGLFDEHLSAHLEEARRLGHEAALDASTWNPLAWLRCGPRALVRRPDPPQASFEWDLMLIRHEAYRRLERLVPKRKPTQKRLFYPLGLLLAAGVLHRAFDPSAGSLAMTGLGVAFYGLAVFMSTGPLRCLALALCDEQGLPPSPRGEPFLRWRGWTLLDQRGRYRDPARLRRALLRVLARRAKLRRGASVLEVCSGAGTLWQYLPQGYLDGWVQTDLEYLSLRYAQTHGLGRRWVAGDLRRLPFRDGAFDAIVGLEALDAIVPADLFALLDEARRLLKPGGVLVHLADYPDYPGGRIVADLNAAVPAAVAPSPAAFEPPLIRYRRLSDAELAAVAAGAAAHRAAGDEYRGDLLSLLLESQRGFEFDLPQRAAIFLIRGALERRGWRVLPLEDEGYRPLAALLAFRD